MSIKKEHSDLYAAGVDYVHESRKLVIENLNVNGETYRVAIRWGQHRTQINGQDESAMSPVLEITILGINNENRFNGTIVDMQAANQWYDVYTFYKLNSVRNRKIDFESVKPIVDEVWKYYISPFGQRMMLEQTLIDSEEEVRDLEEKLALLNGWRESLRQQLKNQLS